MTFLHLKRKLIYKYYYLLDPFYKLIPQKQNRKVFIILSEARSGTTWLAELIKEGLDAAMIWEPIHPKRGLISSKYGRRPYWTENNRKDLKYRLSKIFSGIGINSWTSKMDSSLIPLYIASKPLLVKFTRVNRLLPDIFSHIQFIHKPILLVRHPAAVFLSQYKTFGNPVKGFYWSKDKAQEVIEDPRYNSHKDFINELKDLIHREFAVYCMNNYHIYNYEINSTKYFTVFYEDLLLDPINTLKLIIENWGLNLNRIENKIYAQQAKFVDPKSININKESQLSKWTSELSENDNIIFQSILNHFHINLYNMKNFLPIEK
jgi:hypothetical protein